MPSLGVALKDEIIRLSRKVLKQSVAPLQKASSTYRRDIAQLKREVVALRRDLVQAQKRAQRAAPMRSEDPSAASHRFQARGLKSLRARLDLSAADFGKLVGVSGQTIYNWETAKGTPRPRQMQALAAVRGMGKKQAQARLDAVAAR